MPLNANRLWIVATPLGNPGDLSPRAREVLASADLALAEDTRRTARLLRDCGIEARRLLSETDLPVNLIARSAEVPRSAKSSALGRQLDPAAYVLHRAWVGPLLKIGAVAEIELRQVGTGAKRAPGAGQHQGANGLVGLHPIQRRPQVAVHGTGKAVERGGAVEREDGDGALLFIQDVAAGGLIHGFCLRKLKFTISQPNGRLTGRRVPDGYSR